METTEHHPLESVIPNFRSGIRELRGVGKTGVLLAFNVTFTGPEYLYSDFPAEWREEYERRNYFAMDPIFLSVVTKNGLGRWTDVRLPDVRKIMKRARDFGLIYGGFVSLKSGRKRSFLSVARDDRELTDHELELLRVRFEDWTEVVTPGIAITEGEINVLRHLREGLAQAEIAQAIGKSESTVKNRINSAMKKLGARSRPQAVGIAVTRNLLD